MSGGDLGTALRADAMEHGHAGGRRLGWYARGRFVLQSVANGLAHLHDRQVPTSGPQGCLMLRANAASADLHNVRRCQAPCRA